MEPIVERCCGLGVTGDKLPSGVYFIRLESAGHIEAQKIVMSR
jgi:hypothetical protein